MSGKENGGFREWFRPGDECFLINDVEVVRMEKNHKKTQLTKIKLPEVRCFGCHRLLFCGIVDNVEIKCPRCGLIQNIGGFQQEAGKSIQNK
ncbi:MAG TPA: Com family DNA-binding transcriptional regulator [Selenomonadales bacterium]|nr:Com family DNA-binding transcriptional regulator [Selenomonadales bacterium]